MNFEADAEAGIVPGDRVRLRIVEATPHSLIGTLADPQGGVRTSLKAPQGMADEGIRIRGLPGSGRGALRSTPA